MSQVPQPPQPQQVLQTPQPLQPPDNAMEILHTFFQTNNPEWELEYRYDKFGPEHAVVHQCTYWMGKDCLGQGQGNDRKTAKRNAAGAAWVTLRSKHYL